MKKENKKQKISDFLGDAVVEIILTLILFAIGCLVCAGIGSIFQLT